MTPVTFSKNQNTHSLTVCLLYIFVFKLVSLFKVFRVDHLISFFFIVIEPVFLLKRNVLCFILLHTANYFIT